MGRVVEEGCYRGDMLPSGGGRGGLLSWEGLGVEEPSSTMLRSRLGIREVE